MLELPMRKFGFAFLDLLWLMHMRLGAEVLRLVFEVLLWVSQSLSFARSFGMGSHRAISSPLTLCRVNTCEHHAIIEMCNPISTPLQFRRRQ